MTKEKVISYLKSKKEELYKKYGITTLGFYGSYARDEAKAESDLDVFYEKDASFELESGLEFLGVADQIAEDLGIKNVDFVGLKYMNPIVKHYAQKDFIYV